MLVFRRFFIWIAVIVIAVIYELEILRPGEFLIWLALITLLTLSALYLLYNRKTLSRQDLFLFAISPLLLVWGTFSFLFFLENFIVIQLIIVLSSFFLGVYLDNFFFFSRVPQLYQTFSLEGISSFINIYSLFFITASFISLRIFLNISLQILGPVYLVLVVLFLMQSFWINKFSVTKHWQYLLVIALLVTELAWALDFLTFDFFVKALLIVSSYYCMINLSLLKLKNTLNQRRLFFNLGLLIVVWITTISSARFF